MVQGEDNPFKELPDGWHCLDLWVNNSLHIIKYHVVNGEVDWDSIIPATLQEKSSVNVNK